MKITIDKTDKNLALLRKLGSKNTAERIAAHESLAEFIGPVLQEVINKAPTVGNLFSTLEFNEYDNPSIPLDLYIDVNEEDFIRVWSQAEPGGLPFNMPTPPQKELKFMTYRLDSAVAFHTKYARQSRLDVISKTMTRLAQEVLLKQERNAMSLLLRAVANGTTTVNNNTFRHVIRGKTDGVFLPEDINRLGTLLKRIHGAWNGGTPVATGARGLTDMLVSPEVMQHIRSMAYNPINTRKNPASASAGDSNGIALTDDQRMQLFNNVGLSEFMGVNLIELHELGDGYAYNTLFDYYADGGSNSYDTGFDDGSGGSAFGTNDQIAVALDLASVESLVRPVAVDAESGSQFNVVPDDQFVQRSGKIGFYGSIEEGRVILDDRVLGGLILKSLDV